jgi:hypothetical protein
MNAECADNVSSPPETSCNESGSSVADVSVQTPPAEEDVKRFSLPDSLEDESFFEVPDEEAQAARGRIVNVLTEGIEGRADAALYDPDAVNHAAAGPEDIADSVEYIQSQIEGHEYGAIPQWGDADYKPAAEALAEELSRYSDPADRARLLQALAGEDTDDYYRFVGILGAAGETGADAIAYGDRRLIADTLAYAQENNLMPVLTEQATSTEPADIQALAGSDPLQFAAAEPYTRLTQKLWDPYPQDALETVGNLVTLYRANPELAFNARMNLAQSAIDAYGSESPTNNGHRIPPGIQHAWAQLAVKMGEGHLGSSFKNFGDNFSLDFEESIEPAFRQLFEAIGDERFYTFDDQVHTKEAKKLLLSVLENPELVDTLFHDPDMATACTRAITPYAQELFLDLTDVRGQWQNGDDLKLRTLFELTFHNPDIAPEARQGLQDQMASFVHDLKRDALLLAIETGSGADINESSAGRRLQLFSAAFVNGFKDRYDQLSTDYEAQKQLWENTIFLAFDILPAGSLINDVSKLGFGGSGFKSDLMKNFLNQGNAGSLADSWITPLVESFIGQGPEFAPNEVLNIVGDTMLNLDLDVNLLREDPARFNEKYELPATNPLTGEVYPAVTAEDAEALLDWVETQRYAPEDTAFPSLYVETKQLLTF